MPTMGREYKSTLVDWRLNKVKYLVLSPGDCLGDLTLLSDPLLTGERELRRTCEGEFGSRRGDIPPGLEDRFLPRMEDLRRSGDMDLDTERWCRLLVGEGECWRGDGERRCNTDRNPLRAGGDELRLIGEGDLRRIGDGDLWRTKDGDFLPLIGEGDLPCTGDGDLRLIGVLDLRRIGDLRRTGDLDLRRKGDRDLRGRGEWTLYRAGEGDLRREWDLDLRLMYDDLRHGEGERRIICLRRGDIDRLGAGRSCLSGEMERLLDGGVPEMLLDLRLSLHNQIWGKHHKTQGEYYQGFNFYSLAWSAHTVKIGNGKMNLETVSPCEDQMHINLK